jgi:hypothetical protein
MRRVPQVSREMRASANDGMCRDTGLGDVGVDTYQFVEAQRFKSRGRQRCAEAVIGTDDAGGEFPDPDDPSLGLGPLSADRAGPGRSPIGRSTASRGEPRCIG